MAETQCRTVDHPSWHRRDRPKLGRQQYSRLRLTQSIRGQDRAPNTHTTAIGAHALQAALAWRRCCWTRVAAPLTLCRPQTSCTTWNGIRTVSFLFARSVAVFSFTNARPRLLVVLCVSPFSFSLWTEHRRFVLHASARPLGHILRACHICSHFLYARRLNLALAAAAAMRCRGRADSAT